MAKYMTTSTALKIINYRKVEDPDHSVEDMLQAWATLSSEPHLLGPWQKATLQNLICGGVIGDNEGPAPAVPGLPDTFRPYGAIAQSYR